MRILKARTNFATNSSSTHSLIFLPGGAHDDSESVEFGWEYFTAGSQERKENYFALMLHRQLEHQLGSHISKLVMNDLIGRDMTAVIEDGYVDHQSVFGFPRKRGDKHTDLEFAKAFKNFLLKDSMVILGGNDNDGATHSLDDGSSFFMPGRNYETCGMVSRLDPKGFWTLFNPHSGAKVRMTFDKGEQVHPSHATTPELIDIKITDYCATGCEYCYQGSTTKGVHAEDMWNVTNACAGLGVFEVALGGGEPMAHPEFVEILKRFRMHDIVPNFSTRQIKWLKDERRAKEILDLCGSWAISVDDNRPLFRINGLMGDELTKKPAVHLAVGAMPESKFKQVLTTCKDLKFHTVLLGYKSVGRGASVAKQEYDWMEILKKVKGDDWMTLSVDTALIANNPEVFKEEGIHAELLEKREGAFSAYIDAVNGMYGPSSYCDQREMRSYGKYECADQIKNAMTDWNAA